MEEATVASQDREARWEIKRKQNSKGEWFGDVCIRPHVCNTPARMHEPRKIDRAETGRLYSGLQRFCL